MKDQMEHIERLPDWRMRLHEYLADEAARKFEWGVSDCAIFAAGAIKAMTGHDPAAQWRGRYKSMADGLRLIRKHGHKDHVAAARAFLKTGRHRVGDIAVIEGDDAMPALGVVLGAAIAVKSPEGLGIIPVSEAEEILLCG